MDVAVKRTKKLRKPTAVPDLTVPADDEPEPVRIVNMYIYCTGDQGRDGD